MMQDLRQFLVAEFTSLEKLRKQPSPYYGQ
jgi:hypothetical protein